MTGMATDATSPARLRFRTQVRNLADSAMAPYYFIASSVLVLVGLGTLMVLSASSAMALYSGKDPYFYVRRQLMFLAVGLVLGAAFTRLKPDILRRLGWPAWALAVMLLVLVMVPGLGVEGGGNLNWVSIGPIQFQPSEFAKLALVVWAGAMFHNKRSRLDEPAQVLLPLIVVGGMIPALILAGRDLGTGLILGLMIVLIMWFVGTPLRILVPFGTVVAALVAMLVLFSGNRMSRISIFLDPQSNTDLSSQPIAALYALASGGWWGLGLGASRQKYGGLKDGAHTDYIFAVIGEELGLFGVLLVIALFAVLGWAGLVVAVRSDKIFNKVVAAGITAWFLAQAIINIFVVMHLLPVLGVPLPFVSYGGSALLSALIATGVLMALARDTPAARAYLESRKSTRRPRMTSVMAATRKD